jgi:hypothetical protein
MICEGTHKEVLWLVHISLQLRIYITPLRMLFLIPFFIRPDQWTATTTDGKRSAQFEHTLLVTETGIEILT